jgi:hypothetical protein
VYQAGFVGQPDLGIWIVAALAIIGAAAGAWGVRQGARVLGLLGVAANSAVALLYGFPAVFAILGGAR